MPYISVTHRGIYMILKGFKFGMLLQLAVGPMCILVFSTSASNGFLMGLSLVAAIALIDALFIGLSGVGVAAVIGKDKVNKVIKLFGGIVLILFGINTIIGIFDLSILPKLFTDYNLSGKSTFLQGLILTASNPLTIIFWSGVFSTQVIENNMNKKQLCLFGIGCVLSTLFFLTLVAVLGSVLSEFLPILIIKVLNACVGILLIFFGIKLFFKK